MTENNQGTATDSMDNENTSLLGVENGIDTSVIRGKVNKDPSDRVASQEVAERIQEATGPLTRQSNLLFTLVNSLKENHSTSTSKGNASGSRNVGRPRRERERRFDSNGS